MMDRKGFLATMVLAPLAALFKGEEPAPTVNVPMVQMEQFYRVQPTVTTTTTSTTSEVIWLSNGSTPPFTWTGATNA